MSNLETLNARAHALVEMAKIAARVQILEAERRRFNELPEREAGFILECGGHPLGFAGGPEMPHSPHPVGTPGLASRFTLDRAKGLAGRVSNGRGDRACVVNVRVAINKALAAARLDMAALNVTMEPEA